MELILGTIVSIIVQVVKKYVGTSGVANLAIALGLAFLAAIVYHLLVATELWETVQTVILTTGAFYAFILRNLE